MKQYKVIWKKDVRCKPISGSIEMVLGELKELFGNPRQGILNKVLEIRGV
jgi:hypothetical protein